MEFNTYSKTDEELEQAGIHRLSRTLGDALKKFENDGLAKEVFGEAFHSTFLKYKRREWDEFCLEVTPWERKRYLRLL